MRLINFPLLKLLRYNAWRKIWFRTKDILSHRQNIESAITSSVTTNWSVTAAHADSGGTLFTPRRILYVAPRYDYGNAMRGLSIEENYFFHTLLSLGHEIVRFDPLEIMQKHNRALMNEMLLETEYRYAPDLVFTVLFKDELDYTTIKEISDSRRAITINWFCDDHWRFNDFSRFWAPYYHWVVTTAKAAVPKYLATGSQNVILSQWACNHRLYYRIPMPKLYDVTFVGQPHGNRREIIWRLREAGLDVRVWGFGWEAGRISQLQMVRIFNQSRININLSNASVPAGKQIKGRNFEIPGSGGFLLTDQVENLEDFYEIGKEIVCFSDVADLIDKAKYYLGHEVERNEIAERGYCRTIKDHTFDARFKEIFWIVGFR